MHMHLTATCLMTDFDEYMDLQLGPTKTHQNIAFELNSGIPCMGSERASGPSRIPTRQAGEGGGRGHVVLLRLRVAIPVQKERGVPGKEFPASHEQHAHSLLA